MGYQCYHCGKTLEETTTLRLLARGDECTQCKSELKCCRNCTFYDEGAYHQCKEPQAEYVAEKTRSNFCDYFRFRESSGLSSGPSSKEYIKSLDDLFKNK